jgi:hypothetical protein
MGPFQIFMKILGFFYNFVFIDSVINAGAKLLTGVNDTGDKL